MQQHTDPAEWSKVLEWAERTGFENLKEHHESLNMIASQANTALTVLLAGIGGSLAYAVTPEPKLPWLPVASAFLCAYLIVLAALVVTQVLRVGDVPPVHNKASNLAQPGHSLDALRAVEINKMRDRGAELLEAATLRSRWLNGIRLLAAAAPLLFGAVALYKA